MNIEEILYKIYREKSYNKPTFPIDRQIFLSTFIYKENSVVEIPAAMLVNQRYQNMLNYRTAKYVIRYEGRNEYSIYKTIQPYFKMYSSTSAGTFGKINVKDETYYIGSGFIMTTSGDCLILFTQLNDYDKGLTKRFVYINKKVFDNSTLGAKYAKSVMNALASNPAYNIVITTQDTMSKFILLVDTDEGLTFENDNAVKRFLELNTEKLVNAI